MSKAVPFEKLPRDCQKSVTHEYDRLVTARNDFNSSKASGGKSERQVRKEKYKTMKQRAQDLADAIKRSSGCKKTGCNAFTAADYKYMRYNSPEEKSRKEMRAGISLPQFRAKVNLPDPAIRTRDDHDVNVDQVDADHVYSLGMMVTEYGYLLGCLTPEQRVAVANNSENLFPVSGRVNSSRAERSWSGWPGIIGGQSELAPLYPAVGDYVDAMFKLEDKNRQILLTQINGFIVMNQTEKEWVMSLVSKIQSEIENGRIINRKLVSNTDVEHVVELRDHGATKLVQLKTTLRNACPSNSRGDPRIDAGALGEVARFYGHSKGLVSRAASQRKPVKLAAFFS